MALPILAASVVSSRTSLSAKRPAWVTLWTLMAPNAGHFVQHDAADLVDGTIRAWLDLHPVK